MSPLVFLMTAPVKKCFRGSSDQRHVPLLFCSLVIAVAPSLRAAPSMFQESDHYRLMGRALHWINTELPSITLPEGVEHALTKFAWDQLYRNTPEGESGPTPHKLHPHGGPPLDPSGSTAAPIPIFSSPLKLLKPSERQLITNKG